MKNFRKNQHVGRIKIVREGWKCERCEHQWIGRSVDKLPKVCPSCKSPYWNTPRKPKGS